MGLVDLKRCGPASHAGFALALLVGAGCVGEIGDGEAGSGPGVVEKTTQFQCDPSLVAPELPLRRLSRSQYENTLRDLIGWVSPDEREAIWAEIAPTVATMPVDVVPKEYGALHRLDQAVHQETVDAAYHVGEALGHAWTSSPTRLEAFAGVCATDADTSNDAACIDDFIRRFGSRALRRPMLDEDVAFYRQVVDPGPLEPEDFADLVTTILSAPHFLYFVEHGRDDAAEGEPAPLSAYELASRLSYHFWQTAPDDELLAVAESGELLDDAEYERQVERLYSDPRAVDSLREFFGDWLNPHHLEGLDENVGTPAYDAFRGSFTPGPDLRQHMMDELLASIRYYAYDTDGTFEDLFTSDQSFAETEDVASLYGVPVWSGGEPPVFEDANRRGLLSRAALVATGVATTRPIMKGAFTRRAILCDDVPPPPADAMMVAEKLDQGVFTSREKAEAITELRGDCAACHATIINPLGFATESFDGLGRSRTVETIYDKTTGEVLAEKPVDTAAIPHVSSDDERTATGVVELNRYMIESEKPQACFARHYFRFTFGRMEDAAGDGCTLTDLHQSLIEGEELGSVLRAIARRPEFRRRSFEP
ncbi:MAG: DUF1592 domain-containing protein [Polyangiaceae bacterium]|nr:DUF1592 domain-containing protein [Polyangiaceae bacterium]